MIKVVNVAGARPNFVKIAPIIRAMEEAGGIKPLLVHTGQHYDYNLSQLFFDQLAIPVPDAFLEVGSLPRIEQIEKIDQKFEEYLKDVKPDLVLLVGDVNSTVACSRAARRMGIKVAHVEAGLRSFDLRMPEEVNRLETDKLSDYLFVTEQAGLDNLAAEDIEGKVFFVGNVMIDSLVSSLESAKRSDICERLKLTVKNYAVGTFHRPSNVDTPEDLRRLMGIVKDICVRIPLVLPLHPRTKATLQKYGMLSDFEQIPNLVLTEPIGYIEFMALLSSASVVITDSGGIQEETTYLGVPCITARENTERPVTVEKGTNVLVGLEPSSIILALDNVLSGKAKTGELPPLWDGRAARRIVGIIKQELASCV